MKQCRSCRKTKPVSEFYKHDHHSDGVGSFCKLCHNQKTREGYKLRKSTKLGHAKTVFGKRKREAKYKGLPFDIDLEYALSLVTDVCPMLGIQLCWGECTGIPRHDSPSIDKIIPEKGYVRGNIAWVSYRANSLKSDGTFEEIQAVLKYLNKYRGEVN